MSSLVKIDPEIIGRGVGIHWKDVDSVRSLLAS
jgi:hypothetical protein